MKYGEEDLQIMHENGVELIPFSSIKIKVALFPGSFNPWHEGHEDILDQALKVFDKIVIMKAINPEKNSEEMHVFPHALIIDKKIEIVESGELIRDFILGAGYCAIIRGVRNSQDFEYEKTLQYINEDLGVDIPTFLIISNRSLVHKSSSMVRALRKFGL